MPFCSRCGKQNPQDASFCNYCGNQFDTLRTRVEVTHRFEQAPTYRIVQLHHAYCDGKGIDYGSSLMGVKCRTCEGTGNVSLRIDSTETLAKCRQCNGTGVDHQTSMMGVECKKCHGTGKILQKVLTY